MPTVSALVAEIIAGGAFDADSTTILAWLDRRHKEMVNYAKGYRDLITIDTTDAGVQEYTAPAGIVELEEVTVGGETYVRGRHTDLAAVANGFLWLSGPGGLMIESANASNVTTIVLLPVPTVTGLDIIGYGVVQPPTLLIDNTVALHVDDDLIEPLKSGVYSIGLGQPNEARPDLAAPHEAVYQQGKLEFKRRVRRRLRGSGPTRIRVAGLDA